MDPKYHFIEELEDFLGGTFHQDIDFSEQALNDFINENSKEYLLSPIEHCENFLNSEL